MSIRRLLLAVLALLASGCESAGPVSDCVVALRLTPSGTIDLRSGDTIRVTASQETCGYPPGVIEWNVSNPRVVTVEPGGRSSALVRAGESGVATVAAALRIRERLTRAEIVLRVTGPVREERGVGIIDAAPFRPTPAPHVPDTVQAGTPFDIRVVTYGSSSCTRPDSTQVSVSGLTADVRPFDIRQRGGVCTPDLASIPRNVSLTFSSAGSALVRVHGLNLDGRTVTLEYPVTVR